jgi:hypothetical protein
VPKATTKRNEVERQQGDVKDEGGGGEKRQGAAGSDETSEDDKDKRSGQERNQQAVDPKTQGWREVLTQNPASYCVTLQALY